MAGKKQNPPVRFATSDDVPSRPMSLSKAIFEGSRLDELLALRVILVGHIENDRTLARDLATLSRQLREVSKEIESLEAQAEEKSDADDDSGSVDDMPWSPKAV